MHECDQKKGVITMRSYSYRNINGTRFNGILYICRKLKAQLISPNCLPNDDFFSSSHDVFFFILYTKSLQRDHCFVCKFHMCHIVSRNFLFQGWKVMSEYLIFNPPKRNQQIFEFNQSEKNWWNVAARCVSVFLSFLISFCIVSFPWSFLLFDHSLPHMMDIIQVPCS